MSKVQIFNIVLNILGVSSSLENPNSTDNKAVLLNNYYELARDYVLKDFDWNFASIFRTLALNAEVESYGQFRYCYDYPNDCICARDIFQDGNYQMQPFSISALPNSNKVILTDIPNATLRYTKRIENEQFFTCEFSMALAYYLASLVAGVLVGSIQKGELAYEKYLKFLSRARLLNAREGLDEKISNDDYLSARG